MRVVLAEDSVLLREGLVRLLGSAGVEVVAAVSDAEGLLRAVDEHVPDLVLTDVRMPPSHTDEGLRAALVLRRLRPSLAILVLSQYVEAATGFGTMTVSGIQGDLRLSTTTGDVVVNDSRGALRVRAETGSVIGTGLRSTGADVETGTGNVDLGFTTPPGDVRAVVRTAGDVEVRVPDGDGHGKGYDVRSGSANATVGVRRDPAAPGGSPL